LYSLGLVAYVLLTGKHPFKRASVQAIFAAHLTESPEPLNSHRQVPPDLEVIVMRCLEKAPRMRFEDAASLAAALARTRCAGRWTIQQAEAWWSAHAPQIESAGAPAAAVSSGRGGSVISTVRP
jgi:serine/threonine-protein kinase